jgi:hypothetical protein
MKSKPREKTNKTTNPTQRDWHDMNRKRRREMMREIQSEDLSLDGSSAWFRRRQHGLQSPPSSYPEHQNFKTS